VIGTGEDVSFGDGLPFFSETGIFMATAFGRLDVSEGDIIRFENGKISVDLVRRDINATHHIANKPVIKADLTGDDGLIKQEATTKKKRKNDEKG